MPLLSQASSEKAPSHESSAPPSYEATTRVPEGKNHSTSSQGGGRAPSGDPWALEPTTAITQRRQSIVCEPLERPIVIHSAATQHLSTGMFGSSRPFSDVPAIPSHDVTEEDWAAMLGDIHGAAKLRGGQRLISHLAPLALGLIPAGLCIARRVQNNMKQKKTGDALAVVEQWNREFFRPRQLDVFVAKGGKRLHGVMEDSPAGSQGVSCHSDSPCGRGGDETWHPSRRDLRSARRAAKRGARSQEKVEKHAVRHGTVASVAFSLVITNLRTD